MNIRLEKIGKRYTNDWVFRNLSQEFNAGNIYGLIGHNGSGKSTLLQIISGFITPNEGSIIYGDPALDAEKLYQKVALSAPYLDLLDELTVFETIKNQSKFKAFQENIDAKWLLRELKLEHHSEKLLNQLSSGMKQRLKLGMALYSASELLLLDEPCSNLDQVWIAWYESTLKHVAKNRLIIIASNSDKHELSLCNQPLLDVASYRETP
ncbi:MAG: ATP-binding cassette domain-containing protein [Salibacteraceae bacterium]